MASASKRPKITRQRQGMEFVENYETKLHLKVSDRYNVAYKIAPGMWVSVVYNKDYGALAHQQEICMRMYADGSRSREEEIADARNKENPPESNPIRPPALGPTVTLTCKEADELLSVDVPQIMAGLEPGQVETLKLGDRHRVVCVSFKNDALLLEIGRVVPYASAGGNEDAPEGQLLDANMVALHSLDEWDRARNVLPLAQEMVEYAKNHLQFAPPLTVEKVATDAVDKYLPALLMNLAKGEQELHALFKNNRSQFKDRVEALLKKVTIGGLYCLILANEEDNANLTSLTLAQFTRCVRTYVTGGAAMGAAIQNLVKILTGDKAPPPTGLGRAILMSPFHLYFMAVVTTSLTICMPMFYFGDRQFHDLLDLAYLHFEIQDVREPQDVIAFRNRAETMLYPFV